MKFRRKVIILFMTLLIYSNSAYAKYVYNFDESIVQLSRDNTPPVCEISYSTEEWTNQSVIATITCNEEVQQLSGFTLSDDKKVLTKEVFENEEGILEVRDYSGNCTEIEYEVSNIDKEAPQIIGCVNEETYIAPLSLDYSDNVEIKEIRVDQYSDKLTIDTHSIYYDSYYYYGIDRKATSIKIYITEHPKDTKKYRYYINDRLYATTANTEYIFTGLTKGSKYKIRVEAIDQLGNVLQTATREEMTSYFQGLTSDKTSDAFVATFWNLDSAVSEVKYAVWNLCDETNRIWYDSEIMDGNAYIRMIAFSPQYYPSYVMHVYLYDAYGNVLDVVGFSIDFNNVYEKKDAIMNEYELTQKGNYQIFVNDLAGNETIYYIKLE